MDLSLQNLVRQFPSGRALDGLSLEVTGARVLVLIGPSGGGKSTLLRLLGGLDAPDAGSIVVNGETFLHEEQWLRQWRRQNGFVFQQFNLFPHMSALRNITLPLEKVHGLSRDKAQQTAQACLERFGLADHAQKLPAELSGGQQQRVGLARAIAAKPRLLLLDEPTSALDPEMTAEVLEVIQELAAEGQHIILSTHEMGFARAVGDHVAIVAAGKIAESGAPAEVFTKPQTELARRFFEKVMRW